MKTDKKIILQIGVCLFVFMLLSLFLMSISLQNSELFDRYYAPLFFLNILGLIFLIVLIFLNLKRLRSQLKKRIIGSRMAVRLVIVFSLLSVTPVLVVYYFSLNFLHHGIDSWFDLRVEQALDDSLELSRLALDIRMKELLKITEQSAKEVGEMSDAALSFEFDEIRSKIGASELVVFDRQGGIIVASFSDTSSLVPDIPDGNIILQIQQGNSYVGFDVIKDSELLIRVAAKIPVDGLKKENRIIQALFPISKRMSSLTKSVQSSFIKYKELSYLRKQLKISFIVILTLVLFFSIFSAVWAAFYSATKLTAPIKNLAEGTKAIAEGNYSARLPIPGNYDLGFLVKSFNDMTDKIEQARERVKKTQNKIEESRIYLETVLSRLSSGVLVFDVDDVLEKANISATLILQIDNHYINDRKDLATLASSNHRLKPFFESISNNIKEQHDEWHEQIVLTDKTEKQILMVRGATLISRNNLNIGNVVVFDEITALIQGQRDAAWSEMGRRLAHEIKNPLTPIQLAAERLRHKYLNSIPLEDSDTLERMTNTIIQQVDTMKEMVNNFSGQTDSTNLNNSKIVVKSLLTEAVDLFSNLKFGDQIKLNLQNGLPDIYGDVNKLRQVLNNLIKNAVEANRLTNENQLEFVAKTLILNKKEMVEIRIKDKGVGIKSKNINQLFEPYITTKTKGTGLGLAIAKKIIDEHNGYIWLENNINAKGACAVIRLPTENIFNA